MLRIVTATRHDQTAFRNQSLLGRCLNVLESRKTIYGDVTFSNSAGLPDVFNAALARGDDSDLVLFTHDDVWLDDWFLPERITDALKCFDVVGVAGNRRRVPRQLAWPYCDGTLTFDAKEYLSGSVAHLYGSAIRVRHYGDTPSPVRLLDGVFLAAKVETLRRSGVQFDPRFRFHFYDMDFSRTCEARGLKMGTWPIAITHASGGQFKSAEFRIAYADYLAKWNE